MAQEAGERLPDPVGGGMIVKGTGPTNPALIAIGEAPGQTEARMGKPFVGPTGKLQDKWIGGHFGLSRGQVYMDNLKQEYIEGNPDPDQKEIRDVWGPDLLRRLSGFDSGVPILAVGAFATRFLTGRGLDAVHGTPHYDAHGLGRTILPVYHPAGLLQSSGDEFSARPPWDYKEAGLLFRRRTGPPADEFPDPVYEELDLAILEDMLREDTISIDTEEDVWSFQLAAWPGHAMVITTDDPDFDEALQMFRDWVEMQGRKIVIHNSMYDGKVMRKLGVDLFYPGNEVFDTMVSAYLLRMEPQSLKNQGIRHLGVTMLEYMEMLEPARVEQWQMYIEAAEGIVWEKHPGNVIKENDGAIRAVQPQPLEGRLQRALANVDEKPLWEWWVKLDATYKSWIEEELGPPPTPSLGDIDRQDALDYSGKDADITLRIQPIHEAKIKEEGLEELMKLKMAMLPVPLEMEINGFKAGAEYFADLYDEMDGEMDGIRNTIVRKFCGSDVTFRNKQGDVAFNPLSQPQTNSIMRRLGIRTKKTKTGLMTTSKKYMDPLRDQYEFVSLMSEWREHQKVRDSFAKPIMRMVLVDGRVHGRIQTTRVTSGRFSMVDPNLMAIPVRSTLGLRVRQGYSAEKGRILGTWDLSQIELREMASQSGDERMLSIFRGEVTLPNGDPIDYHTDTAARCFSIPYTSVLKMAHRYPAKRAGFGVITGIKEQGLLDQLLMAGCKHADGSEWTRKEAGDLIRKWFNLHPGVKTYMKECMEECRQGGGVIRTPQMGMPRHLPNIFSTDQFKKWEAERQSHSHKIQGGAQEGLQRAMAWLYPRVKAQFGDKVQWILQVHDELVLECEDDERIKGDLDKLMMEGLTQHGPQLSVPIEANGCYGYTWDTLEH